MGSGSNVNQRHQALHRQDCICPDIQLRVWQRATHSALQPIRSGNYEWDISLRRTFGLGFEGVHMTLQGDLYNVTNHTEFGGIGTTFGSSSFGTVSSQANSSRDAQLMARFEF
jgi:hypothetical protein